MVLASFATFLLSCTALFFGGRWYLMGATDPQQAILKVVVGTVLVHDGGKQEWLLATPEMLLKEGSAIRTDPTSQALVTLFDESTITLLPDTELSFSQLRRARFPFIAAVKSYIRVNQTKGKAVVGVALPVEGRSRVEIGAPQGVLSLSEGSYTLDVNDSLARVRVKDAGRATVTAFDKTVEVARGERVDVYTGQPPRSPEPAAVELVSVGNFRNGLSGWNAGNMPGFAEGTDISGSVQLLQSAGASAVRFSRLGSKGTHNETYIARDINEDVSGLTSLQFTIEFKLIRQSLSGGGYMGSEYPLLVRIHYLSDRGETFVFKGFYYQNEANNRTDNGMPFPADSWITWTMPENLMTMAPIPRKILRIEIGASGHDYVSEVRQVSLSGE